jgi:excisionase family DNA binding protein
MSTHAAEREWLAAKEVAHELGVHVTAVYRAVHEGRLPVVRLSETGAIRIHRSAIDPKEHVERELNHTTEGATS